jgi:hypothetical protein
MNSFRAALHAAPPRFFLYLLTLLFATACSKPPKQAIEHAEQGGGEAAPAYSSSPAWPALALLETGDNPLWFELGADGPELIETPGAASLTDYSPWPHARRISGILAWGGFLVMAVNREGFLVLGSGTEAGEAFLYQISGRGFWDSYTVESFFIHNDRPAVLLYRNDFFIDPKAPSPKPQVYALDRSSPVPLAETVPALENFPPGGSWEAEHIHLGPDGLWYIRMREKGKAQNETSFFQTRDLSRAGTKITMGEWRNSNRPENPTASLEASALTVVLNRAGEQEAGCAALTVSPDFEAQRLFSLAKNSDGENLTPLYAYSRESSANAAAFAVAISPEGRGFYSDGKETKPFALPDLPEAFAYTGIALLEDILLASWEEQEAPAIGAAGFMVMRMKY